MEIVALAAVLLIGAAFLLALLHSMGYRICFSFAIAHEDSIFGDDEDDESDDDCPIMPRPFQESLN